MTWFHAVADPGLYADPIRMHTLFGRLRREQPVAWCEPEGFRPFWALSRYEDIAAASRAPTTFISRHRTVLFDRQSEAAFQRQAQAEGSRGLVRSLVSMDGPEHHAYRLLTQGWFMSGNLRRLEPQIRELARRAVDDMIAKGDHCDFAAEVAIWYPLRVIMMILGLSPEAEPMMLRLTQQLFAPGDGAPRGDIATEVAEALSEFRAFFAEVSADRRRNPTDDLATVIATARIGDDPIGDHEAFSYYNIIATAGHDTTSSTAATGLLALCENPAELAKLRAGDGSVAQAVEEMVRWATPVRHFMRTATQDVDLAGARIRSGDAVMLLYPSGNRDEAAFDAPERFMVDRTPNRHLGFGTGAHSCLGLNLARLELKILFEELLARTGDWRLDGEPQWVRSSFVSGPKHVPFTFRPA